ncbi:MAG: 1,6-anhydro-N-acetylmuramyl-L-alanine amidase AmpD [bacterium]
MDDQHHLDTAEWLPSSHCDERPYSRAPELVVLHCVSLPEGQYGTGYPQALFQGRLDLDAHPSFHDLAGMEVSPHLLIGREGDVQQFVRFDQRAWHAGVSLWHHRPRVNDFAVGIELEGSVSGPFSLAQYDALAGVLTALFVKYPALSVDAVVGHNEIAPGRKEDPGAFFDWKGLFLSIHQLILPQLSANESR